MVARTTDLDHMRDSNLHLSSEDGHGTEHEGRRHVGGLRAALGILLLSSIPSSYGIYALDARANAFDRFNEAIDRDCQMADDQYQIESDLAVGFSGLDRARSRMLSRLPLCGSKDPFPVVPKLGFPEVSKKQLDEIALQEWK